MPKTCDFGTSGAVNLMQGYNMLMLKYDAEVLYKIFQSFVGQRIGIHESISRNREAGHDRHFASESGFTMTLKDVAWSMSGANFYLNGIEGFQYSLSSERIVRFDTDEAGRVTIIEQFETKTERETMLSELINWLTALDLASGPET